MTPTGLWVRMPPWKGRDAFRSLLRVEHCPDRAIESFTVPPQESYLSEAALGMPVRVRVAKTDAQQGRVYISACLGLDRNLFCFPH